VLDACYFIVNTFFDAGPKARMVAERDVVNVFDCAPQGLWGMK